MNHYLLDFNFPFFEFTVLFLLYAETHYSFKGIYSRLKKMEPEIIADVPHRIKRGQPIPVLLLIKDAHQYPIELNSVHINLFSKEKKEFFPFEFNTLKINEKFWHEIVEIQPNENLTEHCRVDVTIKFSINGKTREVKNDNYTCSSHDSFGIYISESDLPKTKGWHFGEFHCHTNYTSDQVEFGAPLNASLQLAQAMGLTFFCATDHSYDLDDDPDNYLKNDPSHKKWHSFQEEARRLNLSNPSFIIIPGEEVSAGNSKNRNVHFLILNHPELLPGDGDSAEKWFRTKPNLFIKEILQKINSDSVAFAAHPGVKPPFLEWLLVRRGKWSLQDCSYSGLHGLQIWNGTDDGLTEGKSLWIELLLKGKRVFISGGNDAHGNFNRFRQVGFPFLTMRENHEHLFGKVRTGVFVEDTFSLPTLLKAFKNGRMLVTDGPFVELLVKNARSESARSGDCISGKNFKIDLTCLSSPEFGKLSELRIYKGDLINRKESLFKRVTNFSELFEYHEELKPVGNTAPSYIRAELYSKNEVGILKCFTNPIWLNTFNDFCDRDCKPPSA